MHTWMSGVVMVAAGLAIGCGQESGVPDAGAAADALEECDQPLPCPPPAPGKVAVCGQLLDMGSGAPLADGLPGSAACDPDTPASEGPCSLRLRPYSALPYLADPDDTHLLGRAGSVIDRCGRFRLVDIDEPELGYVAIVVDDAETAADDHVRSLRMVAALGDTTVADLRMPAMTHATDQLWTTGAGSPFAGETFTEVGAYVALFLHGEARVAGVTITENETADPVNDFYFDDAGPERTAIATGAAATGANGSALLVDSYLIQHEGTGAAPEGCEWSKELAATPAGHVVYGEHRAVLTDTTTPCP